LAYQDLVSAIAEQVRQRMQTHRWVRRYPYRDTTARMLTDGDASAGIDDDQLLVAVAVEVAASERDNSVRAVP
jgi:hypothetical protein